MTLLSAIIPASAPDMDIEITMIRVGEMPA